MANEMWAFGFARSPAMSVFETLFMSRWLHEINLKDSGKVPSGVHKDTEYTYHNIVLKYWRMIQNLRNIIVKKKVFLFTRKKNISIRDDLVLV